MKTLYESILSSTKSGTFSVEMKKKSEDVFTCNTTLENWLDTNGKTLLVALDKIINNIKRGKTGLSKSDSVVVIFDDCIMNLYIYLYDKHGLQNLREKYLKFDYGFTSNPKAFAIGVKSQQRDLIYSKEPNADKENRIDLPMKNDKISQHIFDFIKKYRKHIFIQ